MKNQLYNIFLIILCALIFVSCDKDDQTTIMEGPIAPVLSVSLNSETLKSDDAESTTAAKLSWMAADYGFNALVIYSIQADKAGNNFSAPAEFVLKDLKQTSEQNLPGWTSTISAYTLDSLLHAVGLNTESSSAVEIRLKSTTSGVNTEPVFSNPIAVNVTPYRDVVESPAVLTASTTELNSTSSGPVSFSWTETNYSLDNEVIYTLEFDSKADFSEAKKFSVESGLLEKSFSNGEFLSIASSLGLEIGNTGEIHARVKSYQIGSFTDTAFSNVVSVTTTPYVLQKSLYVPGAHQGWSPATAPEIFSLSGDEKYAGYVFFGNAGNMFKLTSHPDWDHTNYGDGGAGTLSTSGGDLSVADEGYYLIKADLNALTWSAEIRTWGVIGSATPTGWDSDTDLVYDPADQKLKITLNLTAGEIKFRANDDWGMNLGDNSADYVLEADGANIQVTEAGEYEIVLDFTNPTKTIYSLNKK